MEGALSARQFGAVRRLIVWLKRLDPGASSEELMRQAECTTGCDEPESSAEPGWPEASVGGFDLAT